MVDAHGGPAETEACIGLSFSQERADHCKRSRRRRSTRSRTQRQDTPVVPVADTPKRCVLLGLSCSRHTRQGFVEPTQRLHSPLRRTLMESGARFAGGQDVAASSPSSTAPCSLRTSGGRTTDQWRKWKRTGSSSAATSAPSALGLMANAATSRSQRRGLAAVGRGRPCSQTG